MSGYPQRGQYDEGYGHQGNTDSYYQDEQHGQGYYDQHEGYHDQQQGGEGYYDES